MSKRKPKPKVYPTREEAQAVAEQLTWNTGFAHFSLSAAKGFIVEKVG